MTGVQTCALPFFVSHFIGSSIEILDELKALDVEIITTNSYACTDKAKDYVSVIVDVFNLEYVKRVVETYVLQTRATGSPF